MPIIDIKNGKFVEQPTKTKTSTASSAQTSSTPPAETDEQKSNVWLNIITSKFNLILIGIIILLGYLLYRSYKSE